MRERPGLAVPYAMRRSAIPADAVLATAETVTHAASPFNPTGDQPDDPHRVLVVDDDPSAQAAMVRVLQAFGFEVDTARNGLEAFAAIGRCDFAVIVTDVRMPELGGMGFFQQLEELYPSFARRVVFVTAYGGSPDVLAFLQLTGQPYFDKPFDVTALVTVIQDIASRPMIRRSQLTKGLHPPPR